jgi:hypothetical protein
MTNWKYTDATDTVVFRSLDNGGMESCLVSAIAEWLSEGNTPEPADIPPAPSYQELRAAAYPPFSDYLDGIVKGSAEQVQEYVDACLAVKERFPKPTNGAIT